MNNDNSNFGTYSRRGGGIPVNVSVDEETLTITYKNGSVDYFEHDSHLPGSGKIQSVTGNLFSLVGADLLPTMLNWDQTGYAWEFRRVNGEMLASIRWDGEAGGAFGDFRLKFPCLEGPERCERCRFVYRNKSPQPIR